ncbi:MAG: ABC transporter ATP-binding protein, partial [Lachnospiraceae bacterium]|nr:ABC transporter ATP-binding protein [Lachnospiraceae bacterium]
FDGTIIFVSHDRYFIKEIATSVLLLENGETKFYEDGYKDYIDTKKVKQEVIETIEEVKEKPSKPKKDKPKYDIKKLEAEISELEELLEAKRDLRYEPEYYQDSSKMQELDSEIDDIHNMIHAATEKWEEAMEEKSKK